MLADYSCRQVEPLLAQQSVQECHDPRGQHAATWRNDEGRKISQAPRGRWQAHTRAGNEAGQSFIQTLNLLQTIQQNDWLPCKTFASCQHFCPDQHLAGASVVAQCMSNLTDLGDNFNVLIDLLGYDSWPSIFCLQELAKGLGPSLPSET